MAEEFRQLHAERHVIVVQLEDLLSLMQKRDEDIHDLDQVCRLRRVSKSKGQNPLHQSPVFP